MIAVTEPDATIVGAVLVFVVSLAGLYVQSRRQSNAQRGDHADTAIMVREIRDDQREMKADLRDVKDEVRSHGDRLRSLEHWNVMQDETTAIVESNARKLRQSNPHGGTS